MRWVESSLSSLMRFSQKYFSRLPCKTAFHDGLGEAGQPNSYAISQKFIKENWLFFRNRKKQGGKNGLKMAVYRGTYFEWVAKAEEKRR